MKSVMLSACCSDELSLPILSGIGMCVLLELTGGRIAVITKPETCRNFGPGIRFKGVPLDCVTIGLAKQGHRGLTIGESSTENELELVVHLAW